MIEPKILFQDADIVVLDKPPGLLVHSVEGKESNEPTLADWLLKKFPQIKGVGEAESPDFEESVRWGIVHRLDRETSGVMVVALTELAYGKLKKQFAERDIQKTYRAFVYGAMKEDRGIISRAIGRSSTGNRSAKLSPNLQPTTDDSQLSAREAQTTFKTLLRSPEASYLELYPKTGRTHQIRVHLSLLQHPVVCDYRYAPGRPAILGFHRLALHAYKLSFTHPTTGEAVTYEAPLPEEFIQAEEILSN